VNNKPDWWVLWAFLTIAGELFFICIALEIMWGNYHIAEYRGGKWYIKGSKYQIDLEKGIMLK
jgi:hypothetical protein